MTLHVSTTGHVLHAFVNGLLVGLQYAPNGGFKFVFERAVQMKAGTNYISLLSVTVGLKNYGGQYELEPAGIVGGPVLLIGGNITYDLSYNLWSYKVGLWGMDKKFYRSSPKQDSKWHYDKIPTNKTFTWYKTTFKAPQGANPVVVDLLGMGKGEAWVNGQSIGRFWPNYKTAPNGCSPCDYRGPFKQDSCRTGCGEPAQRWSRFRIHHTDTSYVERTEVKIVEQDTAPPSENNGPWKDTIEQLKPCWRKPNPKDSAQTKGFVTLSLTTGPEYHISQISDAVVIARYLGATLVLPDIRGNKLGKKRNFEDMYDVEKFMKSLEGVVTIAREIPAELADKKPALVRVVSKVCVDFIVKNVVPVFEKNSYLRIASSFPTTNMKVGQNDHTDTKSTACLAMYCSLELKSDIKEVAELLVERLRTLNRNQDKHFVAVDLRVDVLEKKSCKESGSSGSGRKGICNGEEDFMLMDMVVWVHSFMTLIAQQLQCLTVGVFPVRSKMQSPMKVNSL